MAEYYIAPKSSFDATADAIRAKTGSQATIEWTEDGFADAIAALGGGSLKYDIGDFTIAADTTANMSPGIPHNLGTTPGCVIVWQSTYTDENIPTVQVNAGYIWLDRIMDIRQRLTSTAYTDYGFFLAASIGANTTNGASWYAPTSNSYTPNSSDSLPTATSFPLYRQGSNSYWRAGVQYHYFVAEAWWRPMSEVVR